MQPCGLSAHWQRHEFRSEEELPVELRQLKYFLEVAEAKSFVSAANKLYISRQAVSKAVAQLEAELGTELFVRDTNGAFLTPEGLLFYDRIRGSVVELERVRTEMQESGTRVSQRIRLGFSVGMLPLFEGELRAMRHERENVQMDYDEWEESACVELLRDRKMDIAFCTGMPQDAEFSVRELVSSPYGVMLKYTKQLPEMEGLVTADLKWIPLAGLRDGGTAAVCERHGLHLQFAGMDLYRLFSLAQRGDCALLLPRCQIPKQFPELIWVPVADMEPWKIRSVCLRSLETQTLYRDMIEEIRSRILYAVE